MVKRLGRKGTFKLRPGTYVVIPKAHWGYTGRPKRTKVEVVAGETTGTQ